MISGDTHNAISSRESAGGPTPSNSPDGPATGRYGPEAVPVSRFRALESTRAMPTTDTYGQHSSGLSPSAALTASLANRLAARMDVNGSPEYALTWKHWDMPAGEPICRLRASPRRTSAPGCIGWPTPVASDANKRIRTYQAAVREAERRSMKQSDLQTVVMVGLAGWGTPQARDWKDEGDQSNIPTNSYLPRHVWHAVQGRGTGPNAYGAPNQALPPGGITGALNPQFSCWLMGYPQEWVSCADSATP